MKLLYSTWSGNVTSFLLQMNKGVGIQMRLSESLTMGILNYGNRKKPQPRLEPTGRVFHII